MKRKINRLIALFVLGAALVTPLLGQKPPKNRNNGIKYHDGQIAYSTVHVYFIFYGNWTGSNGQQMLTDFVLRLGGSPYHNINTTYYDVTGTRAANSLQWGRNIEDQYSHGNNLTDADIEDIVVDNIDNGQLPLHPQGVFYVVGSADVNAPTLCTERCEFHDFVRLHGVDVRYAYLGDPRRCPSQCASFYVDANGTQIRWPPDGHYADHAMINWLAHSLTGIITNPEGNGWFDSRGRENSDKCVNNYGGVFYQTETGTMANVRLSDRNYTLQLNWVNANGGYCALAYP